MPYTMRRSLHTVITAIALAVNPSLVLRQAQPSQVPVATEFDELHVRLIGHATMSGRLSDVAVYEADPTDS